MNYTILAAIGYIAWTVLLLIALAVHRTAWNNKNKSKSLKFDPNGSDVGEFGHRLTRAHANCYESSIFVLGPMLLALATNSSPITNSLALVVLGARIAQSVVHLVSTQNAAITIRFVLFLVQLGISAFWLFQLTVKFI